jgi:Ca2+-binding RTX toxin-like protein
MLSSSFHPRRRPSRKVQKSRRFLPSIEHLEGRNLLATIAVTTTADAVAVDGQVSLREAIISANNNSNLNADVVAVGTYGADTITVPAGTYTLTLTGADDFAATGDLDIRDDLTINGSGSATTIIEACAIVSPATSCVGIDRVFHVFTVVEFPETDATFNGLNIRNGAATDGAGIFLQTNGTINVSSSVIGSNVAEFQGGGIASNGNATINIDSSTIDNNMAGDEGGGIQLDNGTLNITDSHLTNNHADREGGAIETESSGKITILRSLFATNDGPEDGGAIENDNGGDLEITLSTFTGNFAGDFGGAIDSDEGGEIIIQQSTFTENSADEGGAIHQSDVSGFLGLFDSTFDQNTADSEGGAIWNSFGEVSIINSTFAGNIANPQNDGEGGAIYQGNASGHYEIVNATINQNFAFDGGGIFTDNNGGTVSLLNTIIAGSTGGNCSGPNVDSNGHNLEDADDCGLDGPGDLINTDPELGPLTDNGGPTLTEKPLPGSPVIDAGDDSVLAELEFDQRGEGFPRQVGEHVDIGAIEGDIAAALVCEVTTKNEPSDLGTADIVDDADNSGSDVLLITGTNRGDVIVVERQPKSQGTFRVVQNKHVILTFISTDVPRIVIFGLGGNDKITVSAALTADATILGGTGNDVIVGGSGDDQIDGENGNDVINGGAGDDTLCGGNGNDVIVGASGNDLAGGDAGNDVVNGGFGDDLLLGGDGNDVLDGAVGNDHLYGQADNDTLIGGVGNNILVGGDGNDKLVARFGHNILIGGDGKDKLYGNAGDDILIGGSTAHDEDDEALQAILDEWTSGNSYEDRVFNIRNGGGDNGGFVFDDLTVLDDGLTDTLIGDGGRDWFLAGANDKVKDRAGNEFLN